ncbi:MAG: CapA family protein [Acidimicrobiia bacterium]|nr:CapA family protein [Acidimicrobiia bacterium]
MKRIAILSALVVASCSGTTPAEPAPPSLNTVRILLVGDVMTGRGVATVLEREPESVFAGVRHLLAASDIVGGNLESPLTDLPHVSANTNKLTGDPSTAMNLAQAGFDLLALPNNHSTDAGPAGLVDTINAVTSADMLTVGAGTDRAAATTATIIESQGLTVGFLAFDATGIGEPAGDGPGVASWGEPASTDAVTKLKTQVDVVIVSVHGGAEYLPIADAQMTAIAASLSDAGADVVWGHGAHVVQPVGVIGHTTVAATSLGNFLFDQSGQDRTTGAMLEVLADSKGVVAYRVGLTSHPDRRIEFVEWMEPAGDAAWLDAAWWNLLRTPPLSPSTATNLTDFADGDLVAAASGDVTGDGQTDTVVSFRRPHQSTPFMEARPDVQWADAMGRSAHLGVYGPDAVDQTWVAGTVLMPIAALEVCDGSLAVAHNTLDNDIQVASSAWEWNGFGFETAPDIAGRGRPGCADVDGDGLTEPVIIDRR